MGKKSSEGGSGKSGHFSAPNKGVKVIEATVQGNEVTCKFNARKMVGGTPATLDLPTDKVTATFQCENAEHAKLLAEHAKKLHARKHRNGLIYSLNKLSEGITYVDGKNISGSELLLKARARAVKKYAKRQELKAERERRRRMEEDRRLKSEKRS
jgi:hypothetical protein